MIKRRGCSRYLPPTPPTRAVKLRAALIPFSARDIRKRSKRGEKRASSISHLSHFQRPVSKRYVKTRRAALFTRLEPARGGFYRSGTLHVEASWPNELRDIICETLFFQSVDDVTERCRRHVQNLASSQLFRTVKKAREYFSPPSQEMAMCSSANISREAPAYEDGFINLNGSSKEEP